MTEIITHMSKLNLDVAFYNQAFVGLGLGSITTGTNLRECSDFTLVSGSLHFLNEQAVKLRQKKCIFITDHHCNPRKLPSFGQTLFRLAHKRHGGTTNFRCVYATFNIETFTPVQHNKRSFEEYVDHDAPLRKGPKPTRVITPEQTFPIQKVDTWVELPIKYNRHNQGYRTLTLLELKRIFELSAAQQRWPIKRSTFPIVPPSLLHLLLRHAFLRKDAATVQHNPKVSIATAPTMVTPTVPSYYSVVSTPREWEAWTETMEETTSSVKNDDAETMVQLWDMRTLPMYPRATPQHLEVLRRFAFMQFCKRLYIHYVKYLSRRFQHEWIHYMQARGCTRYAPNDRGEVFFPFDPSTAVSYPISFQPGQSFTLLQHELLFGRQTLVRALGGRRPTSYMAWENGSSLAHWRWTDPILARDGELPFIRDVLPNNNRKVKPPKAAHREPIYDKIKKYVDRNYLELVPTERVKNYIDYFAAPKGESDIRLVLNGTSCGLNTAVWSSNFWLPSSKTMVRHLSYGYRVVDMDIGEMFLNFPLHLSLWEYSGMDLTPFRKLLQRDFPEKHELLEQERISGIWSRLWFGFTQSPELAAMMYYLAEEVIRGDHRELRNPLRWDRVTLNLVGADNYDPAMPNVYKWDAVNARLAGDVLSYVDDLRVVGFSLEHAWLIARWVASRMQFLGIQDASRKRRVDNGPWAGGVYSTEDGAVSKSVTIPKWQKGRDMILWLVDEIYNKGNDSLCYKTLERQRGFFCHLAMVYEVIFPYLKGFHLDLCKHYPKRDDEGWKMSDLEWIGMLETKVEAGKLSRREMEDLRDVRWGEVARHPPATVTVGPMFKQCLKALQRLFGPAQPPVVLVRTKKRKVALYGFVDASGGGYGTTVEVKGQVEYRIGTWSSSEANNSSNWREFANLVEEVERAARKGWLDGTVVILATDNEVVEATIYKGNSASPLLFDLVLRLKAVQLNYSCRLVVTQVAGTRMIAQGTDGVSRGTLREGVAAGQRMLEHCPWNKSALVSSNALKGWVESWAGCQPNFLRPEDWYTLGHDISGWAQDKEGLPRPKLKEGCHVWAPPPAASDACMEEIRKARMKRKRSLHIVLVPKLMTPLWMRQFSRIVDVYFFVPAKPDHHFWPSHCHEALYVGLALPYLNHRPFQIRQTPKAVYMGRQLCKVFQDKIVDGGNILRKFLQEYRSFPSVRKDVVWDVLYFKHETPFPRRLPGERVERKRKRSGREGEAGSRLGKTS